VFREVSSVSLEVGEVARAHTAVLVPARCANGGDDSRTPNDPQHARCLYGMVTRVTLRRGRECCHRERVPLRVKLSLRVPDETTTIDSINVL
jgi:hypothetical protein